MRGPLFIDNSPLTVGLVDAVLPIGGVMMSIVGTLAQQAFVDTNSPTMGFIKTQKAIAKSYVAASTQYSVRSAVPAPFNLSGNTLKECSMLVVWTTPSAIVATSTVFGYGISSSVNALFELNLASSKLALTVRNANAANIQNTAGTATISTSTDYCLIGTRSESNNYHRTYINGVPDVDTTATAIGSVSFDRSTIAAFQRNTLTGACGGQVALVLVWNRALTSTEAAALSSNPWLVFASPTTRRAGIVSSTTSYSLNADAGSYLVSGVATGLTATHVLPANPGSYAITGAAARLSATHVLPASPGVYAISGAATSLVKNSGGSTYTLNADPGSYSIAGAATRLAAMRVLNANAGSYFVTGQAASLVKVNRYILQAAAGSYSITGSGAILSPSGSGPTATSDIYLWMRRNLRK